MGQRHPHAPDAGENQVNRILSRLIAPFLLLVATAALADRPQMIVPSQAKSLRTAELPFQSEGTAVRFNSEEMFKLKHRDEVEFTLPDGMPQAYVFEFAQSHGDGIRSWIGQHKDRGTAHRAIITTGPTGSYGVISTPEGDYRLVPGEGHDWLVDSTVEDEHAPGIDLGDDVRIPPPSAKSIPQQLHQAESFTAIPGVNAAGFAKAAPTPNYFVDLMIVYTQGYANALGANLMTRLNFLVTRANTSYTDSEVAITLRLVHTRVVNYSDATAGDAALYSITPDCTAAQCNGTPFDAATFGDIESLRNAYGADIVALLRSGASNGGSGIGWIGSSTPNSRYMYSVTTGCLTSCESVFIHELGHNMGLMHDRATAAWQRGGTSAYGQGAFSYGFGYAYCASGALSCNPLLPPTSGGCPAATQPECSVNNANNFSDIMSYFQGTTMRNYKFSNPSVTCAGSSGVQITCGIVESAASSANAALALNNIRVALSALKAQVVAGVTASTTALTTSANPSSVAQSIALTANVDGQGTLATGTVAFRNGGTAIAGCAAVALSAGAAVCNTSALPNGVHSLTAVYSGSSLHSTSTSAAVSQVVTSATQLLSPSASTVNFGGQSMNTATPPITVTITNTSAGSVTVTGVIAPTGYSVVSHTCTTLAPGATCQVTLAFIPGASGTAAGPLAVTYASGGPMVVNLTGIGERSLVTHYYRSILNRAPDSSGKGYWESEAARMQSLSVDINETWYVMAGYFFNSAEYRAANKTDAQFVADLYNTFFNRPADPSGLAYWTGQIAGGLPREVVLFTFMFSNEFRTFTNGIFGITASRPEVNVVMDFFRGILNRLPDTASFNYWLGRIRTAQCQGAGPVYTEVDAISSAFIFNPEYNARARNNTQFVTDMYYSFLRRGGDAGGVNYWVNQLNSGAMNINTVRTNFLNSPEFGGRVNAVIAAGCLP
jgi:hypothetical protein